MKRIEEERLREEYTPRDDANIENALKIERKMKRPALIFTFIFGIIGALLLGIGMCMTMDIFGGSTAIFTGGVVIGFVGIVMIVSNYPIFRVIMKKRKERYSDTILVALNQCK